MARTLSRSGLYFAACLAGGVLLLTGGSRHVRAAGRAIQTATMGGGSKPSTYEIFAGLWRTSGGFDSTLRIRNELVTTPMDVTPILFMADGTKYELPPAQITAGGIAIVDINRALAAAPADVAAHRSPYGSAALRYRYATGGHIVASIQMLNMAQV